MSEIVKIEVAKKVSFVSERNQKEVVIAGSVHSVVRNANQKEPIILIVQQKL